MIHKIIINNFKKLEEISFQFSNSVVIIGPNNAGKTTIFQALCLWEIGVVSYLDAEKRNKLNKNRAVTINRKNLINSPISDVRFLWKDKKTTITSQGKIEHIRLEVEVQGENNGKSWNCKTEFYYYNEESFSCKIISGFKEIKDIYENRGGVHFGFLQPTSGLSTTEDKLTQGSIDRMLGEGKTSEVLRNICYDILYPEQPKHEKYNPTENWNSLCRNIKKLFNADLQQPELIKITGLIQLEYIENKIKYDVSASGTGFRQLLLLLSYMYSHPNTILLLDEPDAHLEVVRQREVFKVLREVAEETNSQIIIASHSEVVLNEAVATSNVIALIENKVFELNVNKSPKLLASINKALTEYGWDYYYQARLKGHIIFLEGITDRLMLQEFANKLNHSIAPLLEFANFDYTDDNKPSTAIKKHESLKEFFPELKTLALFDKIEGIDVDNIKSIKVMCWKRRELENYFARPSVLIKYAVSLQTKYPHLSESLLKETIQKVMEENTAPARLKDLNHDWWANGKLSDEWLDVIFPEFYKALKITDYSKNVKKTYYELIKFLEKDEIDVEVIEKLNTIYEMVERKL
jgi:ABC-type cobalamin/Fe3+-siderophores transport system ATPase subunit